MLFRLRLKLLLTMAFVALTLPPMSDQVWAQGLAVGPVPEDPDQRAGVGHPGILRNEIAHILSDIAVERSTGSLLDHVRAVKSARSESGPRLSPTARGAKAPKALTVDCTKGQKIQDAVDQNDGPLMIEVRGICAENVRIEYKQVTMRGLDPATDGIQGVLTDPPAIAALAVFYVDGLRIENLSVSNGPGLAIGIWFTHAEMENMRIENNVGFGMHVSSGSGLLALGLTISNNAGVGLNAQRGALVFCDACDLEDNGNWAGRSLRGALLTLRDSVISGDRGLLAVGDGGQAYIDIDCVTAGTGHPCSLTANQAAWSLGPATAALFGAGDFFGQVVAADRAHFLVLGSRQLGTGIDPSGNPRSNLFLDFATLKVQPYFDGAVSHESLLRGETIVNTFSRAVFAGETTIDGAVHCGDAGDAWTAPGVVLTAGSTINGCEHTP